MEGVSGDPRANNQKYSHLGTAPLPIEMNISKERYQEEVDKIFRHSWLQVARVEDVPNPGDYFVQDIPTLETSILIVRGKDKQIRAFHNMCRHRGNKVVHSGHLRGNAKGFSCAFHGWTYDLSGKLVIVPDEDQFFDFDKCEYGLTPVACDVWEGFIFINPDQEPKESLKEWVGEMYDLYEGYFSDLSLFAHYGADIDCNWKIIIDAFMEGYHVPFIHGKTLPEALSGGDNPLCHLKGIRLYKRNRSISGLANAQYTPTAMEMSIAKFIDAPVFPAIKAHMDDMPPGINPDRDPWWAVDLCMIFPITYFAAWGNGMLLVYHFWPMAVDKTRWEVKLYWEKPETAAQRINQEMTGSMTLSVVREDMSSLETTQETMLSGAMDHILLSDQEIAVRHGYRVVEDFLAEQS